MLQGALGSRDVMRLGGAPINSITTDRPSGGGAGIGRQLDAMLRALNPRRKAKGSGDAKRRPSYSIQFLAPFWIISHLAAKHAQLLLQWSSPLRRLNCLPLAGATLFQAKEGTQMMLAGVYAGLGLAVKNIRALEEPAAAALGSAVDAVPRFFEHLSCDEQKVHLASHTLTSNSSC